jgi:gluconokinase
VYFVYLQGDFELIQARLQARAAHYMPSDLLRSQFADLEPPSPAEALTVPIDQPPAAVIQAIRQALGI